MNYAFCEVCSLFSPLEWPSVLQPNFSQFSNLLTHWRLLSSECIQLSVSSHPLCYLGYIHPPPHRGEGGGGVVGVLGLIFAGYVPLASQIPYPIIVYFVANYRPHLSHFWANTKFSRSQLSIYEITLYWMKNTLLFTYSTNILVRLLTVNMKNCLAPKITKCATPF